MYRQPPFERWKTESKEEIIIESKAINGNHNRTSTWIKWAISIGIPVLMFLIIPTGEVITVDIKKFIAITLWAILAWGMNLLPPFVSGLMITMLYILTNTAPASVVLAPWTGGVVWITLGGLAIAVIFEKSGMMERIAYFFVSKTGGTYHGIIFGMMLSGVFTALIVPTMTGRVALYCALAYGICNALNLKKNSRTTAGIMFGGFLSAIAPAWMFLTGSENPVLVNSFLKESGFEISWVKWLIGNAPIMLLWSALMAVMVLVIFRPDEKIAGKEYFTERYKSLGKMTTREKKFMLVIMLMILALVFTKVDPGWIFVSACCLCFIPGINVSGVEDLKSVNFQMVFFVAATLAIGGVSTSVGAADALGNALIPLLGGTNNFGLILIMALLGILMNFVMTPLAALVAFIPTLVVMSQTLDLSVTGATFGFLWGVEQVIFPYEWANFMILYSFDMFDMKKAMKFGASRMLLSIIFLLIVMIPYWTFSGFLG